MSKMVHIWEITCSSCGKTFLHEFRAEDILRPHEFANLYFKCPSCGQRHFDLVKPTGKMSMEEWKEKHTDMGIEDIPEYGE